LEAGHPASWWGLIAGSLEILFREADVIADAATIFPGSASDFSESFVEVNRNAAPFNLTFFAGFRKLSSLIFLLASAGSGSRYIAINF
jgi:hypothetical protein